MDMSLSLSEFRSACEATTTSYGRALLLGYATAAGRDYFDVFTRHFPISDPPADDPIHQEIFPVAATANEQPKTHEPMKIELNITADPAVTAAINNIAKAILGRHDLTLDTNAGIQQGSVGTCSEQNPATTDVVNSTTVEPAPRKKREPKATSAPAPQPEEPAAPAEEPKTESEPEEDVMSGEALTAHMIKLKGTSYANDVLELRKSLGYPDTPLRGVTNKEHLKILRAKVEECLAAFDNNDV